MSYDYASTGTGAAVTADKAPGGEKLSLLKGGEETEYDTGFFAHAYSVIVFDNLSTRGFTLFSTYYGAHKTARTPNSITDIVFRIFVDNEEKFTSEVITPYSDEGYAEVDITGADRLTLIADGLERIGNDHAVWADCTLTYRGQIRPQILADDIEIPGAARVTEANLLQMARATSADGQDITDKLRVSTDHRAGMTGEFSATFSVTDNGVSAEKTVKLTVLDQPNYVLNADLDYLISPFANYVYYGRSLLSLQSRKAYDKIMEVMLETSIADTSVNSVTIPLQENGIYVLPNQLGLIKTYLLYDEARLYYLYDWRAGYAAGISHTKKNGLVDTVTLSLNNGENGYYKGQDNMQVYLRAEQEIYKTYMSGLSEDMTDAQKLYVLHNANYKSMTYANVNYADGFYGAFITKQSICSGYGKGLLYLAQRVGVRGAYVANGTHAWDNFFIEGKWYSSDSTGVGADSNGLLGYRQNNNPPYNFSVMPRETEKDYDRNLQKYGLITIKETLLLKKGSVFDANDLAYAIPAVAQAAPVTNVIYTGKLDMNKAGEYTLRVTATNALGNKLTQDAVVYVYGESTLLDNSFVPVLSGKTNYGYQTISLYDGTGEVSFENGMFTKANGTLSLTYDISGRGYSYFSGCFGIEGQIRANIPWGQQANATVRIYADDELLLEKTRIGWKTEMISFELKLPQGTNSLRLEITDNSGQGRVGWGDCTFYR